MSSLAIVRAPDEEPLDLETEIKPHCRVTNSAEDLLLEDVYAPAARELAETETGRSFVDKGYRQSHDRFPHLHDDLDRGTFYWYSAPRYAHHRGDERQEIKLLRCPLLNVERIDYVDTNGDVQSLYPVPERWQADTEYSVGDQALDGNGNLQEVTGTIDAAKNKDGTFSSGDDEPSPWTAIVGDETADHGLTWTCKKIPAPAGDFLVDRDSEPPRIFPLYGQFWPATRHVPNAVQIYFSAGYEGDLPATGKLLMLQLIGNWYENREATTPDTLKTIPYHLENLVWSLRVVDYAPTK